MDQDDVQDATVNSASSSGQNTEVIGEVMDFETTSVPVDDSEVIMEFAATPLFTTEEINEILDQLTEVINDARYLSSVTEIRAERSMRMDLETTPVPGTAEVTKIMNQATVDDSEIMDFTAEEVYEILDQLTEVINDSKRLTAITEIRTERSMKMDLETTPVPNTEGATKIMSQVTEGFGASGNSENTPILCVERAGGILVPNESTTNIESDKDISKMENETETSESENEKMKTLNNMVDILNDTTGSKKRGRKRKVPPTSDMVMDSIKSLKMSNGASFEDIKKHMEENYPINVKGLLKYHVSNFLQKCVHNGVLQKTGEVNKRFKIKEKSSQ